MINNTNYLSGKVLLVTGAAGDLGRCISQTLVQAGASVVMTDINTDALVTAAEKIRNETGGVVANYQHDVSSEQSWDQIITMILDDFGRIDGLVNNAGVEMCTPIEDMSFADFQRIIQVNVDSVFLGCRAAIKTMQRDQYHGQDRVIVNVSSAAGISAAPFLAAYGASKAAVAHLSKSLARECAHYKYGIRINAIHPGIVKSRMGHDTQLQIAAMTNLPAEDFMEMQQPMGWLSPEDVAAGVLYLMSDAGRMITGASLIVDGGVTA